MENDFIFNTCPACQGPGYLLGKLGQLLHFRCRNCGIDFSIECQEDPEIVSDLESDDLFPVTIQYLDFDCAGDPAVGIRSVDDQIIFGSGLECGDLETLEEIREGLKLFLGDICAGFPVSVYFDFETDPYYRGEKRERMI